MKLKEGIPRHSQISQWLRQQIEHSVYMADEKLPSENDLAKMFNVSRVTIRRALQSLESDSVIYRCQGLGSFVSDKRAPHNLVRLTDFNEDMEKAGLKAASVVREFGTVESPEWLSRVLNIKTGDKVIRIDRLRIAGSDPVAFDSTWLPILYGQLLDSDQLKHTTIYKILEEKYQIPIIRGSYRISAESAGDQLASELDVEPETALLLIDRTSFTIGEKPVYYQKRYYRSDRVMYEMTLERQKDGSGSYSDLPLKEFIPVFKS